jgi:hypothetical protein
MARCFQLVVFGEIGPADVLVWHTACCDSTNIIILHSMKKKKKRRNIRNRKTFGKNFFKCECGRMIYLYCG